MEHFHVPCEASETTTVVDVWNSSAVLPGSSAHESWALYRAVYALLAGRRSLAPDPQIMGYGPRIWGQASPGPIIMIIMPHNNIATVSGHVVLSNSLHRHR